MNANEQALSRLQQRVWSGSLPIEIRLSPGECRSYNESDAYMIQVPRLSYFPFLLPRLHAFFQSFLIDPEASLSHQGWFSYEDVPLKWHYPIGLLYDLYAGAEPATAEEDAQASTMKGSKADWASPVREGGPPHPKDQTPDLGHATETPLNPVRDDEADKEDNIPWRITIHFSDWPEDHLSRLSDDGTVLLDAFRNSLKESSFTRHSTNKPIFSLSYEDSTALWTAAQNNDLALYKPLNDKLLNPPGLATKALPMRLYLPHMSDQQGPPEEEGGRTEQRPNWAGMLRVVQAPVTPSVGGRSSTPQTLGTALNAILPSLFPSRRSPLLALPVLHGAVVPLSADLGELSRIASYADGWLHVAIKMMS